MTEQEIQEIYNRLLALTKAEAIKWKKTGDSEYSVSFSRSSVVIEKTPDYEYSPVLLNIYNEDGLLVAYAATEDLERSDEVVVKGLDPSELFYLVRNQVRSVARAAVKAALGCAIGSIEAPRLGQERVHRSR